MKVMRTIAAGTSSLALIATAVLAAQPAAAATGDVAEFALPGSATAPHYVTSDSQGNLWITLGGSGILAKASLDGTATTVVPSAPADNTNPQGVTIGPDQRIWYAEQSANRISAVTAATGAVQSYPLPNANSQPVGIATGPDGNLWFTEFNGNRIGRITTAGAITEFTLPTAGSQPLGITAGPDGNIWFTLRGANAIGQITPAGNIGVFALPNAGSQPAGITTGPDGNIWFTELAGNRIGRITTAGVISEFGLPAANAGPNQIVTGPDKNLWFTELTATKVGRITTAGAISEFPVPAPNSQPFGITAGSDGNVWIVETVSNRFARVLTGVVPTNTAVPAISGASTAVGQTLTSSTGTWTSRPTSYLYQWQRCSTADTTSCQPISGATSSTYVIAAADAGQRVRVLVNATNLNGNAAAAAASAAVVIGGAVPTPKPTPVTGGQSVTLVTGTTATLKGPKRPRRTALHYFGVRFSNKAVRGTVRITIVNGAGQTIRVLAPHRPITASGVARRLVRITTRVQPGTYTLRAVFTPQADQAGTYPVATMSKPITVRW